MALYRNIAGAEQLGLLLLAAPETDGGGGSSGGTVFYDPGIYTSPTKGTIAIDPGTGQIIATDPNLVTTTPTNTITPSQSVTADTTQVVTTDSQTATAVQPLDTGTVQPFDWWPVITVAGLVVTIFQGERLFGNKRGFVFAGGLGALYYQLYKKQSAG